MASSKRSGVVIVLLILLGLRITLGTLSVVGTLLTGLMASAAFALVMVLLHVGAFLWILRADKRGPMVVFLIAIVHMLIVIFANGSVGLIPAMIFNALLVGLAYHIWKKAGGKNLIKDAQKMVGR